MATTNVFQDSKERAWTIRIAYGDVKRVKEVLGINLAKAGSKYTEEQLADLDEEKMPIYARLVGDPILLVDIVYALLLPQAQQRDVTDVDFGESITPPVFKEMSDIFWRVYHDFFHQSGNVPMAKLIKWIRRQMAAASEKIEESEQEVEKMMDDQIETSFQSYLKSLDPSE